jgi:hypothetical protein
MSQLIRVSDQVYAWIKDEQAKLNTSHQGRKRIHYTLGDVIDVSLCEDACACEDRR